LKKREEEKGARSGMEIYRNSIVAQSWKMFSSLLLEKIGANKSRALLCVMQTIDYDKRIL
jgi:hypothetical protein